jgi:RND family efflux transporter MFP subunit
MAEKRTETADLSALRINRDAEEYHDRGTKRPPRLLIFAAAMGVVVLLLIYVIVSVINSAPVVKVGLVTTVSPTQADAILTASGYVVAQRQAAIASKATGRLDYLGVEEGDIVKKGQIIACLEHTDVDAAFNQARANLEMTEATLKQNEAKLKEAELRFNRQKDLLAKGLISDAEFDIAEAEWKNAEAAVVWAQAQIEQAKAATAAARVNVENTNIRAPFDGTVLTKNADIGEMVAPFAASSNSRGAVVTIADMTSLEVEADVSESNISRVQLGQSCEIMLDAFPNERYPGYVHKIVPTADRAKATVLTKIRFKRRDEKVLPEMSAKVNFLANPLQESDGSLQPFTGVPKAAIATRNGQSVVFVVKEGTLAETPVTTGREVAGYVEVTGGLSIGDQVVLNPTADARSGLKVKIAQ